MKAFNSDKMKEMLAEKIKNRKIIRFDYDTFDSEDFDYIEKIFDENRYKCHAYNIANDEWVPEENYTPSIYD